MKTRRKALRRAIAMSLEGFSGDEEPPQPAPRRVRFAEHLTIGAGSTGRTGGILKDTSGRGPEAASFLGDRQTMLAPASGVSLREELSRLFTPDNLIFVTEAGGATRLTFSDSLGSTSNIVIYETEYSGPVSGRRPSATPVTNQACYVTLPNREAVAQLARELRNGPMLPEQLMGRAEALGGSSADTAGQILMELPIGAGGLINTLGHTVGTTVSPQRFEAVREEVELIFLRLMGWLR